MENVAYSHTCPGIRYRYICISPKLANSFTSITVITTKIDFHVYVRVYNMFSLKLHAESCLNFIFIYEQSVNNNW